MTDRLKAKMKESLHGAILSPNKKAVWRSVRIKGEFQRIDQPFNGCNSRVYPKLVFEPILTDQWRW